MGLNGYSFLEKIAEGSEATIHKAEKNGQLYTIRKYKSGLECGDWDQGDKNSNLFQREINALQDLSEHPAFLDYVEHFTNEHETGEHEHYVVFKYEEGITCANRLGKEVFTDKEIVDIMIRSLFGLKYMHEKGYLHRDIKPDHILLTDKGIKFLDYGLVKKAIYDSNASIVGTVNYWAPETLNENKVSESTDIYSLGISLYEMLIGKRHISNEEIDWKRINEFPMSDILTKMVVKDGRYKKVSKILDDLLDDASPSRIQIGTKDLCTFMMKRKHDLENIYRGMTGKYSSWLESDLKKQEPEFFKLYMETKETLEYLLHPKKDRLHKIMSTAGFGALFSVLTGFTSLVTPVRPVGDILPWFFCAIPTILMTSAWSGLIAYDWKISESTRNYQKLESNLMKLFEGTTIIVRENKNDGIHRLHNPLHQYFNSFVEYQKKQDKIQHFDPEIETQLAEHKKIIEAKKEKIIDAEFNEKRKQQIEKLDAMENGTFSISQEIYEDVKEKRPDLFEDEKKTKRKVRGGHQPTGERLSDTPPEGIQSAVVKPDTSKNYATAQSESEEKLATKANEIVNNSRKPIIKL